MTFWTDPNITPKLKDRFIVIIGGNLVLTAKSVDKPTLSFENKEYKMINHHFKYPGLHKWNSIKIVFIDMNGSGKNDDTAKFLLELAKSSGYSNPDDVSVVEKNLSIEALGDVKIQQITTDTTENKTKVTEEWKLINPIIKSISWGNLAYGEDSLVEYELELDYDYAEFSQGHNMLGSP